MLNFLKKNKKNIKLKEARFYFTDEYSGKNLANMKKEIFDLLSPFEKRSCVECNHLIENVSLWCGNEEAKKERGKSIPDTIKCKHWIPNWEEIDK